ncbi:hypothetical protein FRC04_010906 [Tulasnella sp. 424]|nr:hypothetical protein FRC04_010906 [Tulasnella sp. 424]KAG8975733.1 hypothetical protein FRC05_005251 [Tulasnella sp. 425]
MRRSMYSSPSHAYLPVKIDLKPSPSTSDKSSKPSTPTRSNSLQRTPLMSPRRSSTGTPLNVTRLAPWCLSPESLKGALNAVREDDSFSSTSESIASDYSPSPRTRIPRPKSPSQGRGRASLPTRKLSPEPLRIVPHRPATTDIVVTDVFIESPKAIVQPKPRQTSECGTQTTPLTPPPDLSLLIPLPLSPPPVPKQESKWAEMRLEALIHAVNDKITDIAAIQRKLASERPADGAALRCAVDTMDCLKDLMASITAASKKGDDA